MHPNHKVDRSHTYSVPLEPLSLSLLWTGPDCDSYSDVTDLVIDNVLFKGQKMHAQ